MNVNNIHIHWPCLVLLLVYPINDDSFYLSIGKDEDVFEKKKKKTHPNNSLSVDDGGEMKTKTIIFLCQRMKMKGTGAARHSTARHMQSKFIVDRSLCCMSHIYDNIHLFFVFFFLLEKEDQERRDL